MNTNLIIIGIIAGIMLLQKIIKCQNKDDPYNEKNFIVDLIITIISCAFAYFCLTALDLFIAIIF